MRILPSYATLGHSLLGCTWSWKEASTFAGLWLLGGTPRSACQNDARRLTSTDRLGPLSIEQKKRNAAKRAKLEKNKEDMKKPQEITEDDITRSENETTKNVATVRACVRYACAMSISRL